MRHGIATATAHEVAVSAEAMSANVASWDDLIVFFRDALPPIVQAFEELEQNADELDKAALTFLAEHERALLGLAHAQNRDGDQAALQQVSMLVEKANHIIADQPTKASLFSNPASQ